MGTTLHLPSRHLAPQNTKTKYEICSILTIKTPERLQWCRSGVFIVKLILLSLLLPLTCNCRLGTVSFEIFLTFSN